jgi:hypothetical protein
VNAVSECKLNVFLIRLQARQQPFPLNEKQRKTTQQHPLKSRTKTENIPP